MQAIRFVRSVPRWLAVRALGARARGFATGSFSCIELAEVAPPALPAPDWVRVRPVLSGICGSDLSAIACKGSPYFSPFISTPFVLGHEIVGRIEEPGPGTPPEWRAGQRVVIEPALGCAVRGIAPPCGCCAAGLYAHCTNILKGRIAGGIQTGYCASTGGGWSRSFVAHPSQLHLVPENLSDEAAVLAEPFACAVHAALKVHRGAGLPHDQAEPPASSHEGESRRSSGSAAVPAARGSARLAPVSGGAPGILVLGCGAIGLLTIAAYRALGGGATVWAAARYRHQEEMARKLGADEVFAGRGYEALYRWVLERSGGTLHRPELGKPVALGGVPVVLDCVGSSESLDDALRLAAPRGLVVLVGMPGIPAGVDWTSIWYKELRVQGAYAYGWENFATLDAQHVKTLALALELLERDRRAGGALAALVNRKHPLAQYRHALDEAFHTGASGAYKVVFEISTNQE